MPAHRNDPAVVRSLLTTPATWAVVGLSDNRGRTAYRVSEWLGQRLGMHVLPIHPSAPFEPPVLGASGYAALAAVPDGTMVSVVDCFVRSQLVGAVVDGHDEHARGRREDGCRGEDRPVGLAPRKGFAAHLEVLRQQRPRARIIDGEGDEGGHLPRVARRLGPSPTP